jgi:peptidoglycan/xylan/chitin deacetylase (PgdA/CDA1 family)
MAGQKKKKGNKKRPLKVFTIAIIFISLAVVLTVYTVSATAFGERAVEGFRLWFGGEHQTVTPPENDNPAIPGNEPGGEPGAAPIQPGEEPGEAPVQPGEEPGEAPIQPGEEPKEDPDPSNPSNPIIYAGQVLLIPAAEGSGLSAAQVIRSGLLPAEGKQIALTFDSGWLFEQTIPLLNVLDNYGVKATFYPRALWVQDNPELGKEIIKRGHTMGNHSLTHSNMKELSAQQMRQEMRESTRIIQEVTGVRTYMFRPPYGEYNQQLLEILAETGYPYSIMWTVDSLDWTAGTTRTIGGKPIFIDVDFIVNRVLDNASDNGIVLMHIGGESTVQALPRIIEGLRNMGYQLVTVDKMLPPPGTGTTTHMVKSGETIFQIAQRYGVSLHQIIDANNL